MGLFCLMVAFFILFAT
ncbi:hypothetical protein LEMLEM_LOCUS19640 [Lemmus lemmus]